MDVRSSGGGGRLWLRLLWSRLVYLFHGRWSNVPTGSWRSRCGVLNSFYSGRASLVPSMVVLSKNKGWDKNNRDKNSEHDKQITK